MPREIFGDLIDSEKEILKKLKPMFKTLVKGNGIRFPDSSFTTFDQLLSKFTEYQALSNFEKVLIHEYYLEKLK